jgi:hypothetical protein
MGNQPEWEIRFNAELEAAEAARQQGNEGRARVCARRAIGAAIAEYFRRRGQDSPGSSAYDQVRAFLLAPDVPQSTLDIAEHFLLRVNPAFEFPLEVDLIAEARWLKDQIL